MERTTTALRTACLLLLAGLCIAASGCVSPTEQGQQPPAPPDDGEAREAVIRAHESLIAALGAGDVEALTALMLPEPELLVFHPRLENRFDGAQRVRQGLERMLGRLERASWWETHRAVSVQGDVGWTTSHIVVESPALDVPFLGRGTEIWVRRPDGWKLAHAHWSPLP